MIINSSRAPALAYNAFELFNSFSEIQAFLLFLGLVLIEAKFETKNSEFMQFQKSLYNYLLNKYPSNNWVLLNSNSEYLNKILSHDDQVAGLVEPVFDLNPSPPPTPSPPPPVGALEMGESEPISIDTNINRADNLSTDSQLLNPDDYDVDSNPITDYQTLIRLVPPPGVKFVTTIEKLNKIKALMTFFKNFHSQGLTVEQQNYIKAMNEKIKDKLKSLRK